MHRDKLHGKIADVSDMVLGSSSSSCTFIMHLLLLYADYRCSTITVTREKLYAKKRNKTYTPKHFIDKIARRTEC